MRVNRLNIPRIQVFFFATACIGSSMQRMTLFLMILLLAGGPLVAEDTATSLSTLEGLVNTWARLRTEIASEKREWAQQQKFLLAERDLLRGEVDRLSEEISRFREFSNTEEQEREALLQQRQSLSATLVKLEPILTGLESRIRSQSAQVLSAMQSDFASIVAGFPKVDADTNTSRVVDRMQSLASTLVFLEELHPQLHLGREVLEDGEDSRREMDVLYIGLARAFAVAMSNDWAAVGVPGRSGWIWDARPELASTIRSAIEITRQRRSSEFLELPFALLEMGEGK